MYWWNWVSVYMIIVASGLFIVLPDKPWWMWAVIVLMGGLGVLFVAILPHKKDEYAKGDS